MIPFLAPCNDNGICFSLLSENLAAGSGRHCYRLQGQIAKSCLYID